MVTRDKKHSACAKLVADHYLSVVENKTADSPPWKTRHLTAWLHPTKGGELAVRRAIEAYAAYADDYYDSFETELGGDGYFGGHARNMLRAIRASLNMGFKSNLDSGAVDRLVCELAAMSGFEPDDI